MFAQFAVSLGCYAVTFVLCHLLRQALRRTVGRPYYSYAVEFVDTFHLVCCLFENGMVLRLGYVPFATVLFILIILYALVFEGFANPASVLDYVLRGKFSVLEGGVKIGLELLAAVVAFRYTSFIWRTFSPTQHHYYAATVSMMAENCSTGLNASMLTGFCVEMFSLTFLKLVGGYFHGGRRFWRLINSFISVLVILFGLNLTGALMNPVLSFAIGWGCRDHNIMTHLVVYWLGPFAGILLGNWLVENIWGDLQVRAKTSKLEQNGAHEKKTH